MHFLTLTLGAALLTQQVAAHSWIEQMVNVNDKGDYVGEFGYPRGFIDKATPAFIQDSMNYLLPPAGLSPPFINSSHLLCHPSQRKAKQTDKFPRLQSPPGGFIAMRYAENGHVSDPEQTKGRPKGSGTTFIYGTTEPIEEETLANTLLWNKDGSGGDKRGVLLAAVNFDDARCYEISGKEIATDRKKKFPNFAQGQVQNGPGNYPLMCESNVAIPKDAPTGKPYTIYWVWQWNQAANADPNFPKGRDEYYTTCMDVDVVENIKQDAKPSAKLNQQDAASKAVDDFASRTAFQTNAVDGEMGPIFSSGTPTGGSPAKSTPATSPAATRTGASESPARPSNALPGSPSGSPSRQTSAQVPSRTPLGQSTFQTSVAASRTASGRLPFITDKPDNRRPSSAAPDNGDVFQTVTEIITVTAPEEPSQTAPARVGKPPSAKFRGRSA
jgi:hypothetical protein